MYLDLKKNRVGYSAVMNFESQSVPGAMDICDLFADYVVCRGTGKTGFGLRY
jgi:hypothetical protein